MHIQEELPIIRSRLEVDWYKFTMSRFIRKFYPDTVVRFAFKNRHADRVCLPEFIREEDLRKEIEHARSLRFSDNGLEFVRQYLPPGGTRAFLSLLQAAKLPPVNIVWTRENYSIETEGPWWITTFWETMLMNIVNGLYFRDLARREDNLVDNWTYGNEKLQRKVHQLRTRPQLRFAPFGLRRCFNIDWNRYCEEKLCEWIGSQIVGISNVHGAMRHERRPTGTCAHEMYMVTAGIAALGSDADLRRAPIELTRAWYDEYGPQHSVAIPDTFGSEHFMADLPNDLARNLTNFKIDSGDPIEQGEKWIALFRERSTDPKTKKLIFSDSLTAPLMLKLYDHFEHRVGMVFGPGTHISNDVGFTPISIVVKAIAVQLASGEWQPLVKLSDNLEKSSGPKSEIDRYVRVFDYHNTLRQRCDV